ncbi:MAG: glycosyltransferase family 2 protein [Smithella sp.]
MDISVIIVNWNTKDFLIECLQSLDTQTGNFQKEVIVVDNGSRDDSQEAVKSAFPKVQIIENNSNLGFAKANNIGIKASKGRYLCVINSDVKVLDGCLDQLVRHMDQHPNVGMVGPKVYWSDMTLQSSCRIFPSLWNNFFTAIGFNKLFPKYRIFSGEHMLFFSYDKIRSVDVLVGCFMMARREAVDQVGMLDERFFIYAEDIDWCKRFWEKGWEIMFNPGAEVIHYGRSSSSNDPLRFSIEQMRSVLQYWKKHHGIIKRTIFLIILFIHYSSRIIISVFADLIKPKNDKEIFFRSSKHIDSLHSLIHLLKQGC